MNLFETIADIFSTLANGIADIFGAVVGSISGEELGGE